MIIKEHVPNFVKRSLSKNLTAQEINNAIQEYPEAIVLLKPKAIVALNAKARGLYRVSVSYNHLIEISDETGHFLCRPQHVNQCLEELLDCETPCVSICRNGDVNGFYIYNPEIEPYTWDDNGVIKN